MLLIELFIFVGYERKMEFTFAEIVWFSAVAEPGELQSEITGAITEIDQFKGTISSLFFADRLQVQRIFVKISGFSPGLKR